METHFTHANSQFQPFQESALSPIEGFNRFASFKPFNRFASFKTYQANIRSKSSSCSNRSAPVP